MTNHRASAQSCRLGKYQIENNINKFRSNQLPRAVMGTIQSTTSTTCFNNIPRTNAVRGKGFIITTIIVNFDVNYCQFLGSILVAMLNGCSSSEFWAIIPSLMQAWILYYIPSLLVCLRSLLPPIIFKCSPNLYQGFDRCAVHIFCICPWHLPQNTVCDRGMFYETCYSPVRLTPVVGVTTGAHYRTSIQELLHLRNIHCK